VPPRSASLLPFFSLSPVRERAGVRGLPPA